MSKLTFLLLLLLCAFSTQPILAQPKQPAVADVARELACDCPDCGRQSVDQCMTRCEVGRKHAEEIAAQLKQGRSKEQILNWFADTYGEHLLGNPRPRGFGWLAPLIPFLALLIGLVPVVLVLRSRRLSRTKAEVSPTQSQVDEKTVGGVPEDARLAAALRDFDY
ncbi:MAG: cytochrome c-type biogenesis protein CcmH [Armatimonadota bacterium]|nr:cytochrome c-type biogenesis protein CcmH [Armatimonadota bacterium]